MAYVFLAAGLFLIFGLLFGVGREMAKETGWRFVLEAFAFGLLVTGVGVAASFCIWAGVSLL